MKRPRDSEKKRTAPLLTHVLLGFFISSRSGQSAPSPASSSNLQNSLEFPLDDCSELKTLNSPATKGPRGVDPTPPIQAILWLLGRPWYGRRLQWPNRWLLPRTAERKHLPLPIWLAAKTWLCISPSAKPLDSSALQQFAILLIEIEALLRGDRRKPRPDPNSSRYATARRFQILEASRRVRQRLIESGAIDPWEDEERLSFSSPNAESIHPESKT